jgi:YfiH family protein
MLITHSSFVPKNIKYGFFTKNIPYSEHRYLKHQPNHEIANQLAAEAFGCQEIAIVEQKHTNNVIITNDYNSYCVADGQLTNKRNIALGVITADCVPILLADDKHGIIGSVHAGWRGARKDIMLEAIKKMKELGAKNITAIIGPCIKQKSYEVDLNFYQDFIHESNENQQFFINGITKEHFMFDLPGYVKYKMEKLGLENILDINRNTYDDEESFFSFRRTTHNPNSPMGNLISVIMLT